MMLELTFIDKNNNPKVISVSEYCYERLAKIGFSNKVKYEEFHLPIEEEDYDFMAVQLTVQNRNTLLNLIELERQSELEGLFERMDEKPTIKEIRENFMYVRELTTIYKLLKSEDNIYFTYE